jgi:hypothetical protein
VGQIKQEKRTREIKNTQKISVGNLERKRKFVLYVLDKMLKTCDKLEIKDYNSSCLRSVNYTFFFTVSVVLMEQAVQ